MAVEYEFTANVYNSSSSADMIGWVLVSLPKEISIEIRDNFKHLEQGWGRMTATAKIGNTEWQTAIWFDTKQDTYLLPLKAEIRKKENIVVGEDAKIVVCI